ncbi:MAG: antibiotic ABC transporter ATP-binding protein [Candidatus Chloroheliales bacterium]|nr:MAG: antibiotic ABC transporter ATP-binding protein [Chloroflexota bacterium]
MAVNFHEDEALGKAYDPRLMSRLMHYLAPYKGKVALAFVLILGVSVADIVPPYLTKVAIDSYILPGKLDALWEVLALYLFALVASFLLRYGQTYLMQLVGQRVMYDLRLEIFTHLQNQSLQYFDRTPVGKLMSRLTNDVDALNEMLSQGFVTILGDLSVLVFIVVLLFFLNWQLALITLLSMPFMIAIAFGFQKVMRVSYRATRISLGRINAFLQENISGMTVEQLFNQEQRQFNKFNQLNKDYYRANLQGGFAFAMFFPLVGLLTSATTALLVWFGSGQVLSGAVIGGQLVTLGLLVSFFQYTERAFQPIRDMAEKYNTLQAAMAASERIFMLLDTPAVVVDPPNPKQLPNHIVGDIEFRHVNFQYVPDEPVLRDLSFKVQGGSSVAIVGATGAGKTSIISLLNRFYDIQSGQILIDGVDIRDVLQSDLREHIGMVLQDPVLFSGTIADNIRLQSDISMEQVKRAAEFVNAAHFINRLPNTYDYEVMERGANLSVGQRQLLSFARALAHNPDVLLVLDEATSSVDTETEALIQDALDKLMHARTSIIIAHRLSTIRNVDKIIVLHKGRLVEEGSHDELLAHQGYYYRLYQLQYKEQERALAR